MDFRELNIDESVKQSLDEAGITHMTKIQEKSIPILLKGTDLIGKSQTGTGKTFAFAIPAIEKIDEAHLVPQVLVLLPTRELALQVATEFKKLLKHRKGIHIVSVFGGASMDQQIKSLRRGAQIVVGTPGRVMDMIRRKVLKLEDLKMIVLDEADEMLNMGFREDIEWILEAINHDVQTVLFSATMPAPILRIAKTYQHHPEMVEIEARNLVNQNISQKYYNIAEGSKFEALSRLIDVYKPKRSLVFCNTKALVDDLTAKLQKEGYPADKIHGDMPQASRLKVLRRFQDGELTMLVATDVAARGIDVNDVDIVFNYDVPDNEEYYVHRIGRTGRAGKKGLALTLARLRDQGRLRRITDYTKKGIEKDLIPSGQTINEIKKENFIDAYPQMNETSKSSGTYYQIIDTLAEEGHDPREVAATLLSRLLPLDEGHDLNIEVKPRKSKESGKSQDRYYPGNQKRGRGSKKGKKKFNAQGKKKKNKKKK